MAKKKTARGWSSLCLGGVGLTLALLSGCQTNIAGMTLPSGFYLEHPPQYIPQSPRFPLSRELSRQEEIANAPGPGGPPLQPLPPVVPGNMGQ
jgi:hypothetical protein